MQKQHKLENRSPCFENQIPMFWMWNTLIRYGFLRTPWVERMVPFESRSIFTTVDLLALRHWKTNFLLIQPWLEVQVPFLTIQMVENWFQKILISRRSRPRAEIDSRSGRMETTYTYISQESRMSWLDPDDSTLRKPCNLLGVTTKSMLLVRMNFFRDRSEAMTTGVAWERLWWTPSIHYGSWGWRKSSKKLEIGCNPSWAMIGLVLCLFLRLRFEVWEVFSQRMTGVVMRPFCCKPKI